MAVSVSTVANVLAHAPGLVRYGSRPLRDIHRDPSLDRDLRKHLRSFEEAVAYPPNQVYIGNRAPESLRDLASPWYAAPAVTGAADGAFGRIIPEAELLGLLAECDRARLVRLAPDVALEGMVARGEMLPLFVGDELAGGISPGHEEDEALTANVLLENLACKATGVLALRGLLARTAGRVSADDIDFVVSGSEEAVGDRYQRGGGNIAKAIGETVGLTAPAGTT